MGGIGSWIAVLYVFGLLPLLELFFPAPESNPGPDLETSLKSASGFDWILYGMVPIQYLLLLLFLTRMSHSAHSMVESLGLITAMGVSCGVIGINVAHELGHRAKPLERILARALLLTSLNWQFFVEHNRGHHKNVSTPGDPESAPLGESLYSFWVRAVRDAYRSAWVIDPREMRIGIFIEAAFCAFIGIAFGATALLAFIASSLFGILLLQSVNYIEHYGLQRKRMPGGGFEPVSPRHSWNANQILSRAILFELSRHSDHHAYASRKYPRLRHHAESPQMPTGYPGMILLSLLPPLWFRVMDPKVNGIENQVS